MSSKLKLQLNVVDLNPYGHGRRKSVQKRIYTQINDDVLQQYAVARKHLQRMIRHLSLEYDMMLQKFDQLDENELDREQLLQFIQKQFTICFPGLPDSNSFRFPSPVEPKPKTKKMNSLLIKNETNYQQQLDQPLLIPENLLNEKLNQSNQSSGSNRSKGSNQSGHDRQNDLSRTSKKSIKAKKEAESFVEAAPTSNLPLQVLEPEVELEKEVEKKVGQEAEQKTEQDAEQEADAETPESDTEVASANDSLQKQRSPIEDNSMKGEEQDPDAENTRTPPRVAYSQAKAAVTTGRRTRRSAMNRSESGAPRNRCGSVIKIQNRNGVLTVRKTMRRVYVIKPTIRAACNTDSTVDNDSGSICASISSAVSQTTTQVDESAKESSQFTGPIQSDLVSNTKKESSVTTKHVRRDAEMAIQNIESLKSTFNVHYAMLLNSLPDVVLNRKVSELQFGMLSDEDPADAITRHLKQLHQNNQVQWPNIPDKIPRNPLEMSAVHPSSPATSFLSTRKPY